MIAQRTSSKREISAESFFVDAYETGLEADEVLTEIEFQYPKASLVWPTLNLATWKRPSVGVCGRIAR